MANKYLYHGAAFCGDGTASNIAASAGAVGAWNDIAVFEGVAPAYGTAPTAGDIVYIRSKDAAGANITRTLSTHIQLGGTTGTVTNPISWILDNGTVWSGIDGVLKYLTGTGTARIHQCVYVECQTQDALFFHTNQTWPGYGCLELKGYLKNAKIQSDDVNSNYQALRMGDYEMGWTVAENVHFVIIRNNAPRIQVSGLCRLINPDIEELSTLAGQTAINLEGLYSQGRLEIIGGQMRGVGAADNLTLADIGLSSYSTAHGLLAIGFAVPRSVVIANSTPNYRNTRIELIGLDGGVGAHLDAAWGFATSRTDNYPPTLSAQLPNSTLTPWAWRVYPKNASFMHPAHILSSKVFTDVAGIKTITQEFLVANTFTPTKRTAWITVEYTDNATGAPRHMSTRDIDGAALDTSTAPWSAVTWGMIAFNKHKIQATTPTAVKQDTMITVTFWHSLPSATSADVLFVDPDFSVV